MVLTDKQIKQIAEDADIAIYTIGRNSGEGSNRVEENDFLLSQIKQKQLERSCQIFHETGKQVIVILNIGGVIETHSWKKHPDAILLVWQGEQEIGHSTADVLSGKVNLSDKLPMTFPIHLNDHAANQNFPLQGGYFSIINILKTILVRQTAQIQL